MHEAQMHQGNNSFVTLTYDEEHLPADRSLHYRDFQLFLKRLRKKFGHQTIRFYMCGEYGEKKERPHFHACLFGIDFADKAAFKGASYRRELPRFEDLGMSSYGASPHAPVLFTSATLDTIWGKGLATIGEVTFESAAYVARYVMKKVTGDLAERHYETVDPETGEVKRRTAEFNRMSLKPGIGKTWLEKYAADVYPHGKVVVRGQEAQSPKYYDKWYRKQAPDAHEQLVENRVLEARSRYADNTEERLRVKEQVATAKVNRLARKLK